MRGPKYLLMAIGVCLLIGTLVGARLTGGSGSPAGAGNPAAPAKGDGLVVKGRVVTEYADLAVHLPAHLQAAEVKKIEVKSAAVVKAGQPLVVFDDTYAQLKLNEANAAVQTAYHSHQVALKGVELMNVQRQAADAAVQTADQSRAKAVELREAYRKNIEALNNVDRGAKTIEQIVNENPLYLQADAAVVAAEGQLKQARFKKEEVEKASPAEKQVDLAAANYQVAQAKAAEAKQAVADCVLRAKVPGVIERVAAVQGQVVLHQSQPLMYLIPEGTRFVTAEINTEFAYKIRDRDGSKVVISDDTNPSLTYEGTVEEVGSAFLPKAGGIDLFNGKATYVLEVRIRVADPAPAGKPPLRVNQPVRVTFP